MSGLTYDTGALLAAERGDRGVWTRHEAAMLRGEPPVVPAAVLAQAWRGGPQARLSRLLQGCEIEPLDEIGARAVGVACARSATTDIVDASVVVGALRRDDACVTSDAEDLEVIARALGRSLTLLAA
ncbi:MAG: twitching motility protein PilT [Actinomycetota bacterium]